MIGTSLAHYQIVDKIGEGGMGEVYRADDTRLGRSVALKVLPFEAAHDPERRRRFEQEARAVAALRHPNIVTIFSIEEADGVHFITMELLEGPTLAGALPKNGFDPERLLAIAAPLADAVSSAHATGITHRDLKPTNIMLDAGDRPIVLDFGLAKLWTPSLPADATMPLDETAAGIILGTAAYMSPEQAEGRDVDPRSDVFSLGAILHELATGARAFTGGSAIATIASVLTHEPPLLSELRPEVPPALAQVVRQCLAKNPANRYPSASELRDELTLLRDAMRSGSGSAFVTIPAAAGADLGPRSIVVLPFANQSTDPENEYFSDGLTEEVISDLSGVSALRVISRTTAMQLKGTDKDLRTIASELHVHYVLEGSVRKAGENLRITAQLVDVDTDNTIWSDKYGGTLEDVFAIQEKVSRSIVDALRVTLTDEEDQKLAEAPAASSFAYDVYLRARREIWGWREDLLDAAVERLEHAISIVGEDPLLLRALGTANWQYVNAGISGDQAYLEKAEAYARRIQELDPTSPHGPALLGYIGTQRGDLVGWVRNLGKAVEADPHDPDTMVWLGLGWSYSGHQERGLPLFEKLLPIDPHFDLLQYAIGQVDMFEGRFAAAAKRMENAWRLSPDMPGWPMIIGQAIASTGDVERAAARIDELAPDPGTQPLLKLAHILKHGLRGEAAAASALSDEEFVRTIRGDGQYSYFMAQSHALLGRTEEGLGWLERATKFCFMHYPYIAERDPLIQGLRGDPRFAEQMSRLRLKWKSFEADVGVTSDPRRRW